MDVSDLSDSNSNSLREFVCFGTNHFSDANGDGKTDYGASSQDSARMCDDNTRVPASSGEIGGMNQGKEESSESDSESSSDSESVSGKSQVSPQSHGHQTMEDNQDSFKTNSEKSVENTTQGKDNYSQEICCSVLEKASETTDNVNGEKAEKCQGEKSTSPLGTENPQTASRRSERKAKSFARVRLVLAHEQIIDDDNFLGFTNTKTYRPPKKRRKLCQFRAENQHVKPKQDSKRTDTPEVSADESKADNAQSIHVVQNAKKKEEIRKPVEDLSETEEYVPNLDNPPSDTDSEDIPLASTVKKNKPALKGNKSSSFQKKTTTSCSKKKKVSSSCKVKAKSSVFKTQSKSSNSADKKTNVQSSQKSLVGPGVSGETVSENHKHVLKSKTAPKRLEWYFCHVCKYKTKNKYYIKRHQMTHDRPRILFECHYCDFATRSLIRFKEHEARHTLDKPFKCLHCDYCSRNNTDFQRHQAKHSTVKKYKCPQCDFTTKWSKNVRHHILRHTTVRPHKCHICGYAFKRIQDLKYHLYRHNDVKPISCDNCDFRCKTNYELRCHKLKHSDQRFFACTHPGCSQMTKTKSDLTKHMHTHNPHKSFVCSICQKGFNSRYSLSKHSRIHGDRVLLKCDICQKSLQTRASLRCHLRLHQGVYPFPCDICGRRFAMRGNLHKHQETHMLNDRPYRCPICPYGARTMEHLLAHIGSMHGKSYAYFCEICRKPFKRFGQLKIHMGRMHSTGVDQTNVPQMQSMLREVETNGELRLKQEGLAEIDQSNLELVEVKPERALIPLKNEPLANFPESDIPLPSTSQNIPAPEVNNCNVSENQNEEDSKDLNDSLPLATVGIYNGVTLPLATKGFEFNLQKRGKKPDSWFMDPRNMSKKSAAKHKKYLYKKQHGLIPQKPPKLPKDKEAKEAERRRRKLQKYITSYTVSTKNETTLIFHTERHKAKKSKVLRKNTVAALLLQSRSGNNETSVPEPLIDGEAALNSSNSENMTSLDQCNTLVNNTKPDGNLESTGNLGFQVPPLMKRKPGRPKGSKNKKPPSLNPPTNGTPSSEFSNNEPQTSILSVGQKFVNTMELLPLPAPSPSNTMQPNDNGIEAAALAQGTTNREVQGNSEKVQTAKKGKIKLKLGSPVKQRPGRPKGSKNKKQLPLNCPVEVEVANIEIVNPEQLHTGQKVNQPQKFVHTMEPLSLPIKLENEASDCGQQHSVDGKLVSSENAVDSVKPTESSTRNNTPIKATQLVPLKKKRGRPKGSKNKRTPPSKKIPIKASTQHTDMLGGLETTTNVLNEEVNEYLDNIDNQLSFPINTRAENLDQVNQLQAVLNASTEENDSSKSTIQEVIHANLDGKYPSNSPKKRKGGRPKGSKNKKLLLSKAPKKKSRVDQICHVNPETELLENIPLSEPGKDLQKRKDGHSTETMDNQTNMLKLQDDELPSDNGNLKFSDEDSFIVSKFGDIKRETDRYVNNDASAIGTDQSEQTGSIISAKKQKGRPKGSKNKKTHPSKSCNHQQLLPTISETLEICPPRNSTVTPDNEEANGLASPKTSTSVKLPVQASQASDEDVTRNPSLEIEQEVQQCPDNTSTVNTEQNKTFSSDIPQKKQKCGRPPCKKRKKTQILKSSNEEQDSPGSEHETGPFEEKLSATEMEQNKNLVCNIPHQKQMCEQKGLKVKKFWRSKPVSEGNEVAQNTQTISYIPVKKRKGGRPKGSKNKKQKQLGTCEEKKALNVDCIPVIIKQEIEVTLDGSETGQGPQCRKDKDDSLIDVQTPRQEQTKSNQTTAMYNCGKVAAEMQSSQDDSLSCETRQETEVMVTSPKIVAAKGPKKKKLQPPKSKKISYDKAHVKAATSDDGILDAPNTMDLVINRVADMEHTQVFGSSENETSCVPSFANVDTNNIEISEITQRKTETSKKGQEDCSKSIKNKKQRLKKHMDEISNVSAHVSFIESHSGTALESQQDYILIESGSEKLTDASEQNRPSTETADECLHVSQDGTDNTKIVFPEVNKKPQKPGPVKKRKPGRPKGSLNKKTIENIMIAIALTDSKLNIDKNQQGRANNCENVVTTPATGDAPFTRIQTLQVQSFANENVSSLEESEPVSVKRSPSFEDLEMSCAIRPCTVSLEKLPLDSLLPPEMDPETATDVGYDSDLMQNGEPLPEIHELSPLHNQPVVIQTIENHADETCEAELEDKGKGRQGGKKVTEKKDRTPIMIITDTSSGISTCNESETVNGLSSDLQIEPEEKSVGKKITKGRKKGNHKKCKSPVTVSVDTVNEASSFTMDDSDTVDWVLEQQVDTSPNTESSEVPPVPSANEELNLDSAGKLDIENSHPDSVDHTGATPSIPKVKKGKQLNKGKKKKRKQTRKTCNSVSQASLLIDDSETVDWTLPQQATSDILRAGRSDNTLSDVIDAEQSLEISSKNLSETTEKPQKMTTGKDVRRGKSKKTKSNKTDIVANTVMDKVVEPLSSAPDQGIEVRHPGEQDMETPLHSYSAVSPKQNPSRKRKVAKGKTKKKSVSTKSNTVGSKSIVNKPESVINELSCKKQCFDVLPEEQTPQKTFESLQDTSVKEKEKLSKNKAKGEGSAKWDDSETVSDFGDPTDKLHKTTDAIDLQALPSNPTEAQNRQPIKGKLTNKLAMENKINSELLPANEQTENHNNLNQRKGMKRKFSGKKKEMSNLLMINSETEATKSVPSSVGTHAVQRNKIEDSGGDQGIQDHVDTAERRKGKVPNKAKGKSRQKSNKDRKLYGSNSVCLGLESILDEQEQFGAETSLEPGLQGNFAEEENKSTHNKSDKSTLMHTLAPCAQDIQTQQENQMDPSEPVGKKRKLLKMKGKPKEMESANEFSKTAEVASDVETVEETIPEKNGGLSHLLVPAKKLKTVRQVDQKELDAAVQHCVENCLREPATRGVTDETSIMETLNQDTVNESVSSAHVFDEMYTVQMVDESASSVQVLRKTLNEEVIDEHTSSTHVLRETLTDEIMDESTSSSHVTDQVVDESTSAGHLLSETITDQMNESVSGDMDDAHTIDWSTPVHTPLDTYSLESLAQNQTEYLDASNMETCKDYKGENGAGILPDSANVFPTPQERTTKKKKRSGKKRKQHSKKVKLTSYVNETLSTEESRMPFSYYGKPLEGSAGLCPMSEEDSVLKKVGQGNSFIGGADDTGLTYDIIRIDSDNCPGNGLATESSQPQVKCTQSNSCPAKVSSPVLSNEQLYPSSHDSPNVSCVDFSGHSQPTITGGVTFERQPIRYEDISDSDDDIPLADLF